MQPKLSEGQDPEEMNERLQSLLAPVGKWSLCLDGAGIERTFHFTSWKNTWVSMILGT